jgi:Protein kinase domain/Cyclic nucleotide-binding domain
MRTFQPTVERIPEMTDLEPIGSGGMAEVYRARRAAGGEIVAIKVLKDMACMGIYCDYAERFEREARTAIKLDHPNLVRAHEMGRLDTDRPYLVMEFINGLSAGQNVHLDGPLPVDQALDIFAQVAGALDYMHDLGYVHRDIKPSNILLTPESVAKLGDFGLAKTADDPSVTMAGGIMGTPHYLAPEQISQSAPVDARADIYSLGCTLYFLLVGEPPFKGNSIPLVLTRQLTDPIVFPAGWTDQEHQRLKTFIQRMTAKRPERRYQNMAEVIADLDWVLGETDEPLQTPAFAETNGENGGVGALAAPHHNGGAPIDSSGGNRLILPPGQVIFYEDDLAGAVYWLIRGQVEVIRGGKRLAVITQARKVIGEMALVAGTLRSATVRTISECEIVRIGTSELTIFLAQNKKIMHEILRDMAERIDSTSMRLLRVESDMEHLRNILGELAQRMADGDLKPEALPPLLRELAIDDLTLV